MVVWEEFAIVVLILVIVGIAVFCFTQGYFVVGVICLAGFSKKYGFPALIVTAIYLFVERHWIIGSLPIVLIGWNIIGLRLLKGPPPED